MPVKPTNLIYGLDDRPPIWVIFALGLQHVCIVAISLILPVMVVREMGGTEIQADAIISLSMLAGGIGTILQALKRGPIGSGYLCPQVCGPAYLSASILAAKTGGLALVFGMTALAGAMEVLFSRIIRRLRVLFPPEVTGLIIAMVGICVIRLAGAYFLGVTADDTTLHPKELLTAFLTLGVIVGLNVWSKGKVKLFCILIGMGFGYGIAYALGVLTPDHLGHVAESAWFAFPFVHHPGWSLDISLLIPFGVATLCSAVKIVGDLTTCQKINDTEWKRPDMKNIGQGMLADGIGCACSGLLGGMGQSASSTNIGLAIATSASSRAIGYAVGGLLIGLAFCPKLATVFTIMPAPVMGAVLIFALVFMVIIGFQIVMSRMLDARKTFVVGLALIFGLMADLMPAVFADMPHWVRPFFSSSLPAATLTAMGLNLLFRIGISRKARLELTPDATALDNLSSFIQRQGAAWGARWEIMSKVMVALDELVETVIISDLTHTPLTVDMNFDEFKVEATVRYQGLPPELPTDHPAPDDLLTDPKSAARLAGFLIRHYADKISSTTDGDQCRIHLSFEH